MPKLRFSLLFSPIGVLNVETISIPCVWVFTWLVKKEMTCMPVPFSGLVKAGIALTVKASETTILSVMSI